jgi:hypothetical protein
MHLQVNPCIRPCMQALNAHRLRLRVHCLARMPILAQLQLIHKPLMLLHVLPPHRDEAHQCFLQDALLILGTVGTLVKTWLEWSKLSMVVSMTSKTGTIQVAFMGFSSVKIGDSNQDLAQACQ